jgi:hypothetical protein
MLFKACSFAALSCVKVLPPVGAKWVFPPALAGHQVEFLPPVQPEAPLTLISERLLSLTLSCCVRGFLPSVPSGVFPPALAGHQVGSFHRCSRKLSLPSGPSGVFPPALAGHQVEFLPPVQPGLPLTLSFKGFIFCRFMRVQMRFLSLLPH